MNELLGLRQSMLILVTHSKPPANTQNFYWDSLNLLFEILLGPIK